MAKEKKRKTEKEKKLAYSAELNGLLIVLLVIIGLGQFGIVGNLVEAFAMFLVGTWSRMLLTVVLVIGFYTTLKKEWPKFFTSRLVGLYLLLMAILMFSHIEYIKKNDIDVINIITETINNFMIATKNPEHIQGGGVIGMVFAFLFVKLFAVEGTLIVGIFLIGFGLIMLADISLIDKLKWIYNKLLSLLHLNKKGNKDIIKADKEYERSDKIVISSMEELAELNDSKEDSKEGLIFTSGDVTQDDYQMPPFSLLNLPSKIDQKVNEEIISKNIDALEKVLSDFDISGKVVGVNVGPAFTQYELELKAGTKVSRLLNINREISLALSVKDVRIQAPIPGKNAVGIEIPNSQTTLVTLREILETIPLNLKTSKLLIVLGKNIMGRSIFAEINNMPHLLVAGATGSGKSVCINCIIASLLMRARPDEVKLLLIDPKKVELSSYNGIPHLLAPVVNEPKKAAVALNNIVKIMEERYEIFNEAGVKSIVGYNLYVAEKNKHLTGSEKIKKLPYIIVIIDELADLMIVAQKEVEHAITRITQLARACGIHLIVATQRPSTEVITGLIKANIPSRLAFAVTSNVDSRTILDMSGAEKLLGKGDMLFLPMGESIPLRVQGAFISEVEINRLIKFVKQQKEADYDEALTVVKETENVSISDEEYDDPLYKEIVEFVIKTQKVSASLLQRKYRLGYNRAARIVDLLEERGIVGPPNGSKPREVLVSLETQDEKYLREN